MEVLKGVFRGSHIYVGAGIGVSQLRWKKDPLNTSTQKDVKNQSLSWMLKAGVTRQLNKDYLLDVDITYKRHKHGTQLKALNNSGNIEDYNNLALNIGLRF